MGFDLRGVKPKNEAGLYFGTAVPVEEDYFQEEAI